MLARQTYTNLASAASTLLTALWLSLSLVSTSFADSTAIKGEPAITISSSATAKAQPDMAKLSVSFQELAPSAKTARSNIDKHVSDLIKALSKFDIEEGSLDSSQTFVSPQYDYQNGQRNLLGYQVTRTLKFTLASLPQLDALLQTLTERNISRLDTIVMALKDETAVKAKALRNAIDQSKATALEIAKAYGVSLGKLLSVEHHVAPSHAAPLRARAMSLEANAESATSSYQQKEIEFSATIKASFQID